MLIGSVDVTVVEASVELRQTDEVISKYSGSFKVSLLSDDAVDQQCLHR